MGRKRVHLRNSIGISLEVFPADKLTERPYDASGERPTTEQIMVRQAIKYLTPKQRQVWDLYNYDRLTQDEIAHRLGKKRTTIETQIRQCEARIIKWCTANMEAYKLIKQEVEGDDEQ